MPRDCEGNPLAVGDIVVVIRGRPCCGYAKRVGKVFEIECLVVNRIAECGTCFAAVPGDFAIAGPGPGQGFHSSEIKLIPKPENLAETTTNATDKTPIIA